MAKFLDYSGLSYFWGKIKSYISGKPFLRYDTQSLTTAQKTQARTNIGAEASGQAFLRYDAQSLTDAQKVQARTNIGAGGIGDWTNPNLLDNSWWASGEVINSRGVTSGGLENGYKWDRWFTSYGASAGTWSIGASGITITPASGTTGFAIQPMAQTYNGKVLTASILYSNGNIYTGTITRTAGTSQEIIRDNNIALLVYMDTDNSFRVRAGQTTTIRAVKLELGSYSTLANDTPPDRGEELTRCISATDSSDPYANSGYARSNRNLLDNPWWGSGEVVNQRGVTTKPSSNNVYTIDRWLFSSGADANNWSVGSSGIAFTISASSIWFSEKLANVAALFGKTLTASVLLSNGTVKSGTATITSSASATFINDSALTVTLNTAGTFQLVVKTTQTIRAVKLELGSYSTLINDTPPDYGEELKKCQRYFIRLKPDDYDFILGFGYAVDGGGYITVPLPVTMRSKPTRSYSAITDFYIISGGARASLSTLTVKASAPNGVTLDVTASNFSHLYQSAVIKYANASSYLDLIADL